MIKKILQAPVKIVKGTYKAASWAYKLASGALLGAAIYKGIQKALESRSVPDVLPPVQEIKPETLKPEQKPAGKRKAKKKSKD